MKYNVRNRNNAGIGVKAVKRYTSFQAGPTFSYILFCAYFSLLFLENALISIILTVFTLNVIYAINFLHFL